MLMYVSSILDICKNFIISMTLFMLLLIFLQKIMPLVLKELASSDATNRRNAAFCVGEICKNGGAAALKYVLSYARIIIFHVLPLST
jgi:hypothetical protein